MKLFYATCTSATPVHITLEEAGARYTRVEVSWQRGLNEDELAKVNPQGAVPALALDDGQVLTQSVAIMEHIADTHPQARLLAPPGTVERAHILAWAMFGASDVLRAFGPIVRREDMTTHAPAQAEVRAFGVSEALRRLEHVDRSLAGKTYLVGERFTLADAYVFFVVSLARWLEVPTAQFGNIAPYLQRVAARPATRRILELEDLLD